ncbi:MAG TPA: TOBE domain-containing protein [Burkholderiaceae bacterium]|nr:TOBE domain-containing protein [Burkholderiaceae bacterium]HMZ00941.1 TOBE domain-containing protein [Burkholderiaceae bacterium]HNB43919.1 TOBE domain-containing protein [Burkholderiaceae bacterium]HNG78926.1 TOBE domain-containing protein [Burkholderiaceae bacterium]
MPSNRTGPPKSTRAAAGRAQAAPLTGHLTLETPLGAVLSDTRIRLLEAIERVGSLHRAAREVPLSYKAAWDALDAMHQLSPEPLVLRSTGGAGGGGTRLTDYARRLIALYRAMESSQQDILDRIGLLLPEVAGPELRGWIRRLSMKTSARNQFAVRVTGLADRGGIVDVTLQPEVGPDAANAGPLLACITPESVDHLGLSLGSELFALFKAPAVQILTEPPAPLAGQNVLAGVVSALRPGQARCAVTLTLPGGPVLHAVVEPAQQAALAVGQAAWAVFGGDQVVLVTLA